MDVTCRRCGEPWDAYHLRHDMAWWTCRTCGRSLQRHHDGSFEVRVETGTPTTQQCSGPGGTHEPVRHIEPADNGQVPPQVERGYRTGGGTGSGWLDFVARGTGCPACYGRHLPKRDASWAELDALDTATEGLITDDLL